MPARPAVLIRFFVAIGAPILALVALLTCTSPASATAAPHIHTGASAVDRYVATNGRNSYWLNPTTLVINTCTTSSDPCRTIPWAIMHADPDDTIRVASGVYTGATSLIAGSDQMTQVVFIDRSVHLSGGYTTTNWLTSDPAANPTILDAERRGRVISVVGSGITPTVQGFIITGGDATGLIPSSIGNRSDGSGGGIFIDHAGALIVGNVISDNIAAVTTSGFPTATTGYGGGIYVLHADGAVISDNLIISNTAGQVNYGQGGGVCLEYSDGIVANNEILDNVASRGANYGWGGGIAVNSSDASVLGNLVAGNQARVPGMPGGSGAGIYQWVGGGLIKDNLVTGSAYGGSSVYLGFSSAEFERNTIIDNSTHTGLQITYGGTSPSSAINNVVARGGSSRQINLVGSPTNPLTATLAHNTVVCGGGSQTGVYIETAYVLLNLWNSIVAGCATGVTNTQPLSSTANAEYTLFWNVTDPGIVGLHSFSGDPNFIDPVGGDFHIGLLSAAIDQAVPGLADDDIDHETRPLDGDHDGVAAADLGADELVVWYGFLPLVLRE